MLHKHEKQVKRKKRRKEKERSNKGKKKDMGDRSDTLRRAAFSRLSICFAYVPERPKPQLRNSSRVTKKRRKRKNSERKRTSHAKESN